MPAPGGSSPVMFFPPSGDNTLDALINFQYKWGTGGDRMRGGAGNDYHFVDSAGNTIDEQGNADKGDQVFASVSVNLTTLGSSTIENVILISDAALSITGSNGNNFLAGREGANNIAGGGGDDFLFGLGGNDTLTDTSGSNYMEGGAGNDNSLTGDGAGETFIGGLGADTLSGGGGKDVLSAGCGNDSIHVADASFVRVDGGGGIDTLHLDYSGAIDFGNLDGNASISDRGRIENVDVLDVVNGSANAMTLHLADILDLDVTVANVGGNAALDDVLRIDGDASDTLNLFSADGWGGADTSSLAGYAIYSYQAVKVAVDTGIAVSVT
jgi:hypothetical protein